MFAVHLCQISVVRKEPSKDFNTEKADRELSAYFRDVAIKVVTNDLLKAPCADKKKKAQKKIESMIETEERLKGVKKFVEEWNYWRDFYLKAGPIKPKTKSQLTMIENAIEFCNKNDYKLLMMIACVHKAYVGYKFNPGFDVIERRGEDLYEANYDLVEADAERADYTERALR